jgi:2-polyprenyl-6-hydroxyphenyl methylase/3-demethylubiquinone-9 3-methyltransferase
VAVDYREGRPEDLLAWSPSTRVIALEVIEHVPVAERARFCAALAGLVRPGGPVILSTLNRTPAGLGHGEAGGGIPAALAAGGDA